jgi:hypothetical protein
MNYLRKLIKLFGSDKFLWVRASALTTCWVEKGALAPEGSGPKGLVPKTWNVGPEGPTHEASCDFPVFDFCCARQSATRHGGPAGQRFGQIRVQDRTLLVKNSLHAKFSLSF